MKSELSKKLAACLATLSPGCKQAAKLQSRALLERLSFPERFGLRLHLWICGWCRRFGEQVTFLHFAAHHCAEEEPMNTAGSLAAEARERIRRAMQGGGK